MCLMEARAESSDVCGQGVVRRGKEDIPVLSLFRYNND